MGVSGGDHATGYGRTGTYVLHTLREMIADGELRPGQHVRQGDIATRLRASQVPVREALKVLVSEGTIVHRPNQGHFVARVSSSEMRQLCWMRDTAEVQLARSARWPTAAELATLDDLVSRTWEIAGADPSNVAAVAGLDRAFHFGLWALSPDALIREHAERMWLRIAPYRTYVGYDREFAERVAAEHAAIVTALRDREREALVDAVVAHHVRTQETIRRVAAVEASTRAE